MEMAYSEERGTWNIFTDEGEWYAEGTYEQMSEMMDNYYQCEYEEEEYYEEEDWGFESSMPCDTYGFCAGLNCSNYHNCQMSK